ncbi:hypothetical protein B0H14DRAFT_2564490 [Mycena olivaceomarginata]|nr:hypothetical protein B0H14DRAFT_2564490 [Mycena olivaceomarginata]
MPFEWSHMNRCTSRPGKLERPPMRGGELAGIRENRAQRAVENLGQYFKFQRGPQRSGTPVQSMPGFQISRNTHVHEETVKSNGSNNPPTNESDFVRVICCPWLNDFRLTIRPGIQSGVRDIMFVYNLKAVTPGNIGVRDRLFGLRATATAA